MLNDILKKRYLIVWVVLLLFIFLSPPVSAKLVIPKPEEIVDDSTLIVVGKVKNLDSTEERIMVTMEIESVLKGNEHDHEIVLSKAKPPMYGWLGFHFPPEGSRILLFLRKEGNEYVPCDLNSIALVNKSGGVNVYKGVNVDAFDKYFQTFFEENYRADGQEVRPDPSGPDTIKEKEAKAIANSDIRQGESSKTGSIHLYIIGFALLVMVFIASYLYIAGK